MSEAYRQALGEIREAGSTPAAVGGALLAALRADGGRHVDPGLRPDLELAVYRLAGLPGPDAAVTETAHRLSRELAEYERDKWLQLLEPGSGDDGRG